MVDEVQGWVLGNAIPISRAHTRQAGSLSPAQRRTELLTLRPEVHAAAGS